MDHTVHYTLDSILKHFHLLPGNWDLESKGKVDEAAHPIAPSQGHNTSSTEHHLGSNVHLAHCHWGEGAISRCVGIHTTRDPQMASNAMRGSLVHAGRTAVMARRPRVWLRATNDEGIPDYRVRKTIPIFPLGVVALPAATVPLMIFEAR